MHILARQFRLVGRFAIRPLGLVFANVMLAFTLSWSASLAIAVPPALPSPAERQPAPDFNLPCLDSPGQEAARSISLSDYSGQVILLDFWASWCGPCRASFPAYDVLRQQLQGRFGKDRFEILAVNVDISPEEAKAFLKQTPVDFPLLRESSGATQQAYQLVAMPSTFLIDRQGRIAGAYHGFSPGSVKRLEAWVETLVKEPGPEVSANRACR